MRADHLGDPAWDTLEQQVRRLIEPVILAQLAWAVRGRAKGWLAAEVEDLKQIVWIRLCDHDYKALRRFQGRSDRALASYLVAIARSVVRNHLKRPEVRVRLLLTHSLDDPGERAAPMDEWTYRIDRRLEAALYIHHRRKRLRRAARNADARRRLDRIITLRLKGYTSAEISRVPALALGERAVQKITARLRTP